MKRTSKLISLFLSVLMAVTLCVPAFAAETEADPYASLKEGTGYVAIGDSFTRGYGAGTNWQNEIYLNDTYGNFNCRNVGGSYPNVIAEKFGLNTPDDIRDTSAKMWPLCHDAVSTAYILDLLGVDDGFRDEEFTYKYGYMMERYETDLRYFGDPRSLTVDGQSTYGKTGEVMSVREMIKNASLITLGVGQTDVIYKTQIFGLNTLDMSDVAKLPEGIAHILELYNQYFAYWKKAYPILLDAIHDLNPDAKVILVGTMNPIKDATLTDDIAIEIGSLINFMMDSMNNYAKLCACKYDYTFIDITDVDTPASTSTMSIGHILSISDDTEYALIAHPTANGYVQIGEKIIDVIEKDLGRDPSNLLSGFKNVKDIKSFFEELAYFIKMLFSKITGVFKLG